MFRFLLPCFALVSLVAPSQTPAPPFAVQAETLLAARYTADAPGAAVLVVRDGKVIFRKGYGLASVELKVPVNPEMTFRIGSMTKQFTAAGILLLAEEGKVNLQAPISQYLKKTPASWAKITVEMLLNHTSGLPNYTSDPAFGQHFREDFTPERLLETFVNAKPLDFEPGTKNRYSNTGFYLLGLILEKASGQSWDTFLKTRIFEPLGMTHTRLGKETELIPGLVSGYTAGPLPAPYLSMTQPGAAGALVSTVDDLAAWTQALHGGKVLKPASLLRMLAPTRLPSGQVVPYGYGIASETLNGRTLVGHGGGINGFVCFLLADPNNQSMAVILNNWFFTNLSEAGGQWRFSVILGLSRTRDEGGRHCLPKSLCPAWADGKGIELEPWTDSRPGRKGHGRKCGLNYSDLEIIHGNAVAAVIS